MDSPTVPSKRPRLSVEVKPNVSWTQDEWTELLENECRIKEERAHQIASKLAEQDFNTGRFSSFISEWQNNWEGCKGILLGIGFQDMEIVSFVALLRRHTEKATTENQTQTTIVEIANRKRPMCNELVWAVCKGIGVVKTSDRILLTSTNIYAYLEKAFRKKLIYRDMIRFIKTNDWCTFQIDIDQLYKNIKDEMVVVSQRVPLQQPGGWRLKNEYELWTNHLHICVRQTNLDGCAVLLLINVRGFENAHVHFFVRLIASQFRPIALDLTYFYNSTFPSAISFLNKMQYCIDWVELDAEQFPLEPISAVLNKCNKLAIYSWNSMDEDQMRQFCDAFIRWINARNGGQPKMCAIYGRHQHELIPRLLDAVNQDFARATHKRPFTMRIEYKAQPLAEFTMHNANTQEQLELQKRGKFYILKRQPTTELDAYIYKQMEWELKNAETVIIYRKL